MHIPRRNDLVAAENFCTCKVGLEHAYLRSRTQVQVDLSTVAGAPTPGRWALVINHTRYGKASALRGKPLQVLRKKKTILECSIENSARDAGASTPGIVVGDLNLAERQVQDVLDIAACRAFGNVRKFGGKGHAWQ